MQVTTLTSASTALVRFRAWLVAAIFLLRAFGPGAAFAQTPAPAYYSTAGSASVVQPPLVAGSGMVTAEANAADGIFTN
jgi:hypothetical protein